MTHTTGAGSLAKLISAGGLRTMEKFLINRRSATSIEGEFGSNGNVIVGRSKHSTPSEAGKKTLVVGSVDGWLRGGAPRLGGITLDEVSSH